MSLNSIKVGSAALIAVLFVGGACSKSGDGLTPDQKAQLQKAQAQSQQIDEQSKTIDKLTKQADLANQDQKKAQDLEEEQARLTALQEQLNIQKTQQDNTQAQIDAANQRTAEVQTELEAVQRRLAERNKVIQETVDSLKNQQVAPKELRQATYSNMFNGEKTLVVADVAGSVTGEQENVILNKIRTFDPMVRHGEKTDTGTVKRFMFSSQSPNDLITIEDFVNQMSLTVSFNSFNRIVVKSYIQLQKNRALISGGSAPKFSQPYYIGQSAMINLSPNDVTHIDDVYSYTILPTECNPEITPDCFYTLRVNHYLTSDRESLRALKNEVASSVALYRKGKFEAGLTDRSESIQNILLKNVVYAEIVTGNSKIYKELPLNTTVSQFPKDVKSDPNRRGLFLAAIADSLQKPLMDPVVQTVDVTSGPSVDPSIENPELKGEITAQPLINFELSQPMAQ